MVEHVDSAREVGAGNKWQLSRHPVLHIALDEKVVERVEGGCAHAYPHLSRLRCRIGQFVVGTWSAIAVVSERSHELTPGEVASRVQPSSTWNLFRLDRGCVVRSTGGNGGLGRNSDEVDRIKEAGVEGNLLVSRATDLTSKLEVRARPVR